MEIDFGASNGIVASGPCVMVAALCQQAIIFNEFILILEKNETWTNAQKKKKRLGKIGDKRFLSFFASLIPRSPSFSYFQTQIIFRA